MAEMVASWTYLGTRFTVYAEELHHDMQYPPLVREQANRRGVAPAGPPEPRYRRDVAPGPAGPPEPRYRDASRSPRRDVAPGPRHRDASRSTPRSTSFNPV